MEIILKEKVVIKSNISTKLEFSVRERIFVGLKIAIVHREVKRLDKLGLELKSISKVDQVYFAESELVLKKILQQRGSFLIISEYCEHWLNIIQKIKINQKEVKVIFYTSIDNIQERCNNRFDGLREACGFIFEEMGLFWSRNFVKKAIENIYEERLILPIKRILIESGKGINFVELDEIYFIEKVDKRVIYHIKDREYVITATLEELEKKLSRYFFRSHRSYLINIKKISSITSTGGRGYKVEFEGIKREALISYARKKELVQLWE
ncbi:MAG: LytTR family transcriptional regulator DNA-binding domain-containing protein [Halanaerobiales bacterium]|nr:LytTR family transcriptional regulator DNA-binding domain-containing protein [Halanaerobiales bacterium]